MKVKINLESLNSLPVDEKGFVKVDIVKKRETDEYGNTHYMCEDKWKPSVDYVKKEVENKIEPTMTKEDNDIINDLPF